MWLYFSQHTIWKPFIAKIIEFLYEYHLKKLHKYKKLSFPLRISSVNMTNSTCRFWLLKKSVMENFIFVQWYNTIIDAYMKSWLVVSSVIVSLQGRIFFLGDRKFQGQPEFNEGAKEVISFEGTRKQTKWLAFSF